MSDKVTTIKKEVKISMPGFTQRKKIEVIALYQDNNYDLDKTSQQTGVSKSLIRQWHKELGRDTFKGRNDVVAIAGEVESEKQRIASQISLDLIRVRQVALERMEQLIMKSDNLENVTKAVDALTRAIKEDQPEGISGTNKLGKNSTYQIINQQFNVLKQGRLRKDGDNKDKGN
jgi:transposase-like protein